MNYFEHHIGDYDKNTSHLTACEDGIYHRMLRRYYDKEQPLPADVNEVKRLMRARLPIEKRAVDDVLTEFFHLEADGWHHAVCDEAIAAYLAGEPEREAKKANEDNRLRRHRDERSRLFKVITDAGEHAPWNAPMADLRKLADRLDCNAPETCERNAPVTQPATAPATPATATQTPNTKHQTPNTSLQDQKQTEANTHDATGADLAVVAAVSLRRAGFLDVTSVLPDLQASQRLGIDPEDLIAVALEGRAKRKRSPGRWGITTAIARHEAGDPIVQSSATSASGNKQHQLEERNRAVASAWVSHAPESQEDQHAHD